MSQPTNSSSTPAQLEKIKGRIVKLAKQRDRANFFFLDSDKSAMGVLAVAAATIGASGAAAGTAIASSELEEEVDYVEFELGTTFVRGWLWRSPFSAGDEVEVVGEKRNGHFEAIAIARPSDRTVALYPHCSRGTISHLKNAIKWWFLATTGLVLLAWCMIFATEIVVEHSLNHLGETVVPFLWAAFALYIFFGVFAAYSSWRWMKFVRTAERAFEAFGWEGSRNIDLPRRSKEARRGDEPSEYGVFYFRY